MDPEPKILLKGHMSHQIWTLPSINKFKDQRAACWSSA